MRRILAILVAVAAGAGAYLLVASLGDAIFPRPSLRLVSSPPAEVYLNGERRGVTPVTVSGLREGDYAVRFVRSRYAPAHRAVSLHEPGETACSVALTPIDAARMAVVSEPAGATVYVDGVLRGRTPLELDDLRPGARSVQVAMTNFFPETKTVVLEGDDGTTVSFHLADRQEQQYRARIRANRYDMHAYNDLVKYLNIEERYEAAGEVAAEGLAAAGESHRWTGDERSGLRRFQNEWVGRNRSSEYRHAAYRAIVRHVGEGHTSSHLLGQVQNLAGNAGYRESVLEAMQGFTAKHDDNAGLMLRAATIYRVAKAHDRMIAALDTAVKLAPDDFNTHMSAVREALASLATAGKERDDVTAAVRRYLGVAGGMKRNAASDVAYLTEQANFAWQENRRDDAVKYMRQAVEKQKNKQVANALRLSIAKWLLAMKNEAAAEKELKAVVDSKVEKDPSIDQAKAMLQNIEKQRKAREAAAKKKEAAKKQPKKK